MLSRVLVLLLATAAATVTAAYRRKVLGCEGATVQLFCEDEKVIRVLRANYGRISASVCPAASSGSWSTRCIQPTTLRQVAARCSGAQAASCSLAVTSRVFGDPCPDTPKYLEVVYTCETSAAVRAALPAIPDWVLKIRSVPEPPHTTATTTTSTTTTAKRRRKVSKPTTKPAAVIKDYLMVVTERVSQDTYTAHHQQGHLPESLPLMNGQGAEQEEEETIFVNQPKAPASEAEDVLLSDSRLLPAIIVTSVCVFIICVVAVYLALHRGDPSPGPGDMYTIVTLDTSGDTVYTPARDKALPSLYTPPPHHTKPRTSHCPDQNHYYQIV